MPMELRLKLCAIVSLQHKNTEREALSHLVQELAVRWLQASKTFSIRIRVQSSMAVN
jgi:hypothetical protein